MIPIATSTPAWVERIELGAVVDALSKLRQHYGEDRYRVSPLLQRRALGGAPLRGN